MVIELDKRDAIRYTVSHARQVGATAAADGVAISVPDMPMTRHRWTTRKRSVFLATLRDTANVSAAARAAGLPRRSAYQLRDHDPAFREDWEQALEEALDDLEAELRRRAIEGVEKPVFYAGKPCGTIRTYSDQLGVFLLKCRRPEVFAGERGDGGEPFERELMTAKEELSARLDRLVPPDDGGED